MGTTDRVARAATFAVIAATVGFAAVFAVYMSVDISTRHLDGAFQTASGLFRMADGQAPGRDFQPYLGLGVTYLLYPFFLAAGGNMAASSFAAYFVIACATSLGVGLIAFLASRSKEIFPAALFALGALFIAVALPQAGLRDTIEQFYPGNSLRPLRAFLPYIATLVLYLAISRPCRPVARYAILGSVAGAATLWSNDFGAPTAGLLGCFTLAWAFMSGELSVKTAAALALSALAVSVSGMFALTHGSPLPFLDYSFRAVAHDQYWYFGPWSEESRILTVGDFFTKFAFDDVFPHVLVLAAVAALALHRRSPGRFCLLFLGTTVIAGGAVATVGGHRGYGAAFIFWANVTALAWTLLWLVPTLLMRRADLVPLRVRAIRVPRAVFALAAFLPLAIISAKYAFKVNAVASDPQRVYVEELGGYLPAEFAPFVAEVRQSKDLVVLEEYWGLWGAMLRKHPAAPVDSVIHALGDVRGTFGKTIEAMPDRVLTTLHGFDQGWQSWSVSVNWWFYGPLIEGYRQRKVSPTLLIWERADNPKWTSASCSPQAGTTNFRLDNPPGLYEVTIRYDVQDLPARALLMVENNYNTVADADGYVALDPRAREAVFPALVTADKTIFGFRAVSKPEIEPPVRIADCSARRVEYDPNGLFRD